MIKKFLSSKAGRIIYWIIIALSATAFLFSAAMIALYYYDGHRSDSQYEELSEIVQEEQQPEEKRPTAAEKYAPMLEKNSDFIGWIRIDDTRINYPVLQRMDQKNYYLRRGFDKKYSYYGVPYAFEDATFADADNFVIYGHHMDNGSMFSDLMKYRSENFYRTHKYVYFDTMEGYGIYEILAVVKTAAGSKNEFKYFEFSVAESSADFEAFLAECHSRSIYDTGVTAEYGDKLLTLSTCEYSVENGRLAIIAKQIKSSN